MSKEQDASTYALQANVVGEFATGAINHTLLVGTDLSLSFDGALEASKYGSNYQDLHVHKDPLGEQW